MTILLLNRLYSNVSNSHFGSRSNKGLRSYSILNDVTMSDIVEDILIPNESVYDFYIKPFNKVMDFSFNLAKVKYSLLSIISVPGSSPNLVLNLHICNSCVHMIVNKMDNLVIISIIFLKGLIIIILVVILRKVLRGYRLILFLILIV